MKNKLLGFVIFFLGSTNYAFSQSPFFKIVPFTYEETASNFSSIYVDAERFIWLTSDNGLFQFDGRDYVRYTNEKTNQSEAKIFYEDKKLRKWVGFKNGAIAMLSDSGWTLFKPAAKESKAITSILEDRNGRMWFTTAGNGIYYSENGKLNHINVASGLSDDYTYVSYEDNLGRIWIGTDQGITICKFGLNGLSLSKMGEQHGLPDAIVRELKADALGNIWIGLQDKGICKYNILTQKVETLPCFRNWNYGQVNKLLITPHEIWIATEEHGLLCLNTYDSVCKQYDSYEGLKFNRVVDIVKDSEGNIWMLTESGLMKTHGNWLLFMNELNHQEIGNVHALYIDDFGNLFFTPDQGLAVVNINDSLKRTKYFVLTPPEKLIDIVSLYEDEYNHLWVGTMGAGLFRLNLENGNVQHFKHSLLEKSSIMSISGYDTVIYLGTFGGALKCTFSNSGFSDLLKLNIVRFNYHGLIGNDYIYTVFTDSKKRIWFGTDENGLTCYTGNKYIHYSVDNGLASNTVYSIVEDKVGNIWFTEAGQGLAMFSGKEIKHYGKESGLRDLNISSLTVDHLNRLIAIHNRGIDIFNPASGKCYYYGAENNLADISPDINTVTQDASGKIWFGTKKGIVVYDPALNSNPPMPSVVIQKVLLYNRERNYINTSQFEYNQNYISFEYTGLWFTDPGRIHYQYMLEGYSNEWINTADQRVTFPVLAPGSYTFKVRSSIGNNYSGASETSFSFVIKKPFWKEYWFRALSLLLVLTLIYLYIKKRDQSLKNIEALKKESIEYKFETLKSQVNPHFLFNSFNTLIGIIEQDKEIAVEYVEKLSDYFRNMVKHREKEFILLSEEIEMVNTYYFLQRKRFGSCLQLEMNLKKEVLETCYVPPLSLQLLIENAIKHNAVSAETPLTVTLFTEDQQSITVKNNVNPKLNKEPSTGIGLPNIINRYKILTKQEVHISYDQQFFSVTVPLISPL